MKYWWLKLARYALPEWHGLLIIGCLMLLGIALGLLTPWPMKLIIDNVLDRQELPNAVGWIKGLPGAASRTGLLGWLAFATVGLYLLKQTVNVLHTYLKAGVGSRMVFGLATDLFDVLQRRSLHFHSKQRTGDLIRRVTADTSCVRELVLDVYLPLLTSLITMIAMCVVMWNLSPSLAVFAFLLIFPLALVIKFFARPMSQRKFEEWEVQGEMSSFVEQNLSAMPVVQAFGREDIEDDRFHRISQRCMQASFRSEISQHQFRVGTGIVTAIGTSIVMIIGGISVLENRISIGSLLVMVAYFAALYSPIETLAYLSEGVASAAAGARRVNDILVSDEGTIMDVENARPLHRDRNLSGISIRFDNVVYGYASGRPVLQGISLHIKPGESIALVGATGAGKSTLVSLIPRLFDPWQGTVYFDDLDIRQLQVSSVRENVAIVPQDPFLLPLSIAENIAYARPHASRAEIVAAAVASKADAFIQQLPSGYDTIVGERGVTLSGGERQRLSIARALLKNAPILILDEPTSALDAQTESLLVEALDVLMRGRTTIIIAHRLSTVRKADRIVVLEGGRVEWNKSFQQIAAGTDFQII